MNALVVIETLTPAVYAEPGGIEALIAKLEADVRSVTTDVSTLKGRKEISSLAFKVARSKTALDDMGKDLVADLKKQTGAVDAERRKIRDRLDALRDEVRKPLDDYEAAEASRVAGHERAIADMVTLAMFDSAEPSVADIKDRLSQLSELPAREWQEFAKRAEATRAETFAKLTVMLDAATAREVEAAEAQRTAAEAAARAKKEREDRIAAEAADQARLVAEAKAARELRIVADAQREAEQQKADAIDRANKAERDAATAAAKAESDRIAAEQKAEQERVAAIDAERRRVAAELDAEQAATEKRERNKAHRKRINSDALAALVVAA